MDNKSILITGAKGFLGGIFHKALSDHRITELDLKSADINADLGVEVPSITEKFDVVIHCAGKAHVIPKTRAEEEDFFRVNLNGTKNLCAGLDRETAYPQCFVFISTVSVYGLEVGQEIKESCPLKGDTPYALSKIQAEEFIRGWARKNNVNYLILRLPLIVGGQPPGNLGKMIAAIKKRHFLQVNGGRALKSMVVAKDLPAVVISNLHKSGTFNLTDGHHPSFKEIEDTIAKALKVKKSLNLPLPLAKLLSLIGQVFSFFPFNKAVLKKMTLDLTFDDKKAVEELNWRPSSAIETLSRLDY